MTRRATPPTRVGGIYVLDGRRVQIIGQATPSGYWACPVDGGPAVRVLVRHSEARLAKEFRA